MKTLADMKRDLSIGRKIMLKEVDGIIKNEPREVFKVQTQSICFLKEGGGKSWLDIPKASLCEYDGKTIEIYRPAIRELTEQEKKIIDAEPRDEEQDRIDAMSDGSTMYNRRRNYYKECGFFYLFGTEKEQGKRLTHVNNKTMIQDESIKGKLDIVYELI
jgi:hypothetical protein